MSGSAGAWSGARTRREALRRLSRLLSARLGNEQIKVATRPDTAIKADDNVLLQLEHDHIAWLDPETERAIGA